MANAKSAMMIAPVEYLQIRLASAAPSPTNPEELWFRRWPRCSGFFKRSFDYITYAVGIVSSANQEHGIITSRSADSSIVDLAPLGSRVRILPIIHACATAGMDESYGVVDARGEIVERWPRVRGR